MRWRHVLSEKDERRKKIMDRLVQAQMNEGYPGGSVDTGQKNDGWIEAGTDGGWMMSGWIDG